MGFWLKFAFLYLRERLNILSSIFFLGYDPVPVNNVMIKPTIYGAPSMAGVVLST